MFDVLKGRENGKVKDKRGRCEASAFFMWCEWMRSDLGFGFKGLPVGVDCDDELMIEVVMICAVLVLEGGKDAIFFWCQCPCCQCLCFVINVHI